MADDDLGEKIPPVSADDKKKLEEDGKLRSILASVYTFVRSRELNKNIAAFTFDHYIAEAIKSIRGAEVSINEETKQGRGIRDAAGEVIGIRPSKLEELEKLEAEFKANLPAMQKKAQDAEE
jgi:hypothetical protein